MPPEPLRHPIGGNIRPGASSETSSRLVQGLALVVLAAVDIGLAGQLAGAIGTVLAERGALLFPVLAATGCLMTLSAALALTWLLIADHRGSQVSIFS